MGLSIKHVHVDEAELRDDYFCFYQTLLDILSQSEKDFSEKLNCEYSVSGSDGCRVQCDRCGFLW